jgi:hypothetical protein
MALGFLPNAFGFVWTDGPVGIDYFRAGFDLHMNFTDAMGNRLFMPSIDLFANVERNGTTTEDVFVGVFSDVPITEVTIFGIYYGDSEAMPYIEIDHVQYGLYAVPEPGTFTHIASLLAVLTICELATARRGRRHERRNQPVFVSSDCRRVYSLAM